MGQCRDLRRARPMRYMTSLDLTWPTRHRSTGIDRSARTLLAPALSMLASSSAKVLHMSTFKRWSVRDSNPSPPACKPITARDTTRPRATRRPWLSRYRGLRRTWVDTVRQPSARTELAPTSPGLATRPTQPRRLLACEESALGWRAPAHPSFSDLRVDGHAGSDSLSGRVSVSWTSRSARVRKPASQKAR